MELHTKKGETATGEVSIWAIPTREYKNGEWTSTGFKYALETGKPYTIGAVQVCTQTLTLDVPEGVNLLQAAVETLQKAKQDLLNAYLNDEAGINKQIESLQLLGYSKPIGDDVIESDYTEEEELEDAEIMDEIDALENEDPVVEVNNDWDDLDSYEPSA